MCGGASALPPQAACFCFSSWHVMHAPAAQCLVQHCVLFAALAPPLAMSPLFFINESPLPLPANAIRVLLTLSTCLFHMAPLLLSSLSTYCVWTLP